MCNFDLIQPVEVFVTCNAAWHCGRMKHAETVTFGGSGLDRAALERGSVDALWQKDAARSLVLWQGKPLVTVGKNGLVFLPSNHPMMRDAAPDRVFLGRSENAPIFAVDLSGWTPQGDAAETLNTFLDPSEQVHPTLLDGSVFAELRAIMTGLSPRDAELAATARGIFGWHATHRFCSTCGVLSDFAMGGWQRNCPDCTRSHFPRTDPVVIMLITDNDDNVLVGRSPGWPLCMYSLLAGFV